MRSVTPAWLTAATVSPPPITVKAEDSATAARHRHRPGREGRLLEHAHGPVPDDGLGRPEHGGEALDASAARCRAPSARPGCRAPTPRGPTGCPGPAATTASTGSTMLTPRRRAASSVERAISIAIDLDQRLADAVTERAQEREGHAAADDERVDLREQVLDERDLVGDLGAAEHGDQRPRRGLEDAAQRLQLAPHEQAGRGRLQVARDGRDRGVGAVRGREGVVDVEVGQRRPGAARSRRRWPPPRDGSAGSRAGGSRRVSAPRASPSTASPTQSGASGTGRSSSACSRSATGLSEYLGSGPPLGRPRWEASTTAAPRSSARRIVGSDRGEPGVVTHRAVLEGRVEIGAQEDAPSPQVHLLDRQLHRLVTGSCR